MKKCIIFASHIPNPNKLYVGKESLDKFVESFKGYDIYIGINNSCTEWVELVKKYSDKLNIIYEITPTELLDTSGGAAYQTALRLLKNNNKKYELYWFGHTKGATSNCDIFRNQVFSVFWDKKEIIEKEIFEGGYSLYSPWVGVTTPNYINTTLPLFISGKTNNDVCSFYSFWVHSGEVINKFIKECDTKFFNSNLLTHKRLNGCNTPKNKFIDRYFFERDFPMIYQKICKEPKLLYYKLHTKTPFNKKNINKINF
jgi:hypothetical protein